MYTILDAIGAFIAGSALLITLFTALLNIQGHAYNTTVQIQTNTISERVTNVLEDYLSYVATGSDINPSTAIIHAQRRSFSFNGKIQETLASHNYVVKQGTPDGTTGWYPIEIIEDGTKIMGGNIWADQQFEFRYYDADGNLIPFLGLGQVHATDLPRIRSMSVEMSLVNRGWEYGTDMTPIHNQITFWKFFKNMYL